MFEERFASPIAKNNSTENIKHSRNSEIIARIFFFINNFLQNCCCLLLTPAT